jgi:hypothetical protein
MPASVYLLSKDVERPSDVQLVDELDVLLGRACDGDRRALLAIAVAFGPRLVAEAREELPEHEERAADAVVEFVNAIGSGSLLYTRGKRAAVPWMVRMVRRLARRRRTN